MQVPSTESPGFLAGGGEMGALIRANDWSKTPLGPPENWPQSLKTCVRIVLTSSQPMFVWWGNDLINIYNDPYRSIVGGKHPSALGQPASVVWREIWDQVGPRAETAIRTNVGTYDEALLLIMERNGYAEETYYTFSYSPVPGDDGGPGGILCANTDDTGRIVGERQLKTLKDLGKNATSSQTLEEVYEKTIQTLAENNRDFPFLALFQVEKNGLLRSVGQAPRTGSPAMTAFTTALGAILAEKLTEEFTRVELLDGLTARFGALPAGAWPQSPDRALLIPVAQSGQRMPFAVLVAGCNPYRLPDEKYLGFFGLVADQIATSITNVRAYEEERRRAEALREIDQAKTLFFSNVSHEFRTPLTLMLGPLEEAMKANGHLPTTVHEHLRAAHRNALRLQKLVNSLLDFSRIEAGRMRATYTPTDLAALTADLASSFRSAVERVGMALVVECPPLPEPVYVDREMWEKIVLNLLSNAFKYTLEGQIALHLSAEPGQAVLRVQDTGVGIPDAELPRLFERFHRVAGSRGRTFEGTGIGLSLIRELVGLHGGTIDVASTPGEGSTFTVRIPLGKDHLPAEHVAHATGGRAVSGAVAESFLAEATQLLPQSSSRTEAVFSGKKAHVLVVDDNADMRAYIQRLLEPHYRVSLAPDGQTALWLVAEHRPDLVLSDVMMPVMDGFELLKTLKADPQTARTPVVLLSARAGEEATIEGYEAGADDYLVKPFSANELLARVRAQLNMARVREEAEGQLRTLFEQAPVAMCILRGPNHVVDLANERMFAIWDRQPGELLGKPLFEVIAEASNKGFEDLLNQVLTTGEPLTYSEMPAPMIRRGKLETAYVNASYQPLRDGNGTVTSVMIVTTEVTENVLTRQKIEESEERLRLAVEATDLGTWDYDLRTGVITASDRLTRMHGLPPGEPFSLERGLATTAEADRQRVAEAAARALRPESGGVFEEEYTVWVDGQPRTIRGKARTFFDERGEAYRLTGTGLDVTERRRAERAAAFLADISEELASLETIGDIMQKVGAKIGAHFASFACAFTEIDEATDTATVNFGWNAPGAPSLVGTYRISEMAHEGFLEDAHAGRATVVSDVATDPRLNAERLAALGIGAYVNVPLLRDGEWKFQFAIHDSTVRDWRDDEVALMHELTARIWTRLERARIEEALRESEEKYRTLFETIDDGFCLLELIYDDVGQPVDLRYLETNRAFEQQTGFIGTGQGKTVGELFGEIEPFWIETYDRVAKTGEPARFENYTHVFDRWYSVFASRVGGAGSRQVAVVFNDVTERKRREANLALLAEVAEDLASLETIGDIMRKVGAKVGTHFGAFACAFTEIDEATDTGVVNYGWNRADAPSLVGTYRISDIANESFLRDARAGRVIVVRNAATDPRSNPETLAALGIGAYIDVPFLRDGEWRFQFAVYDSAARDWRDDEVALMQELTTRIWTRLERSRAEEALRESEERYRTLFESMDQGYCTIQVLFNEQEQPVDYRFEQINPAFAGLTGLPEDSVGKTMRELVPDLEDFWPQTYGRVALTGEAVRLENQAKAMHRWFDVYAQRIGAPEERRVGILFTNITERKRREANLAFLAEVAIDLARVSTPEALIETVGPKIGAYLGVSACLFGDIDEAADTVRIEHTWEGPESPNLRGTYRLSDFVSADLNRAAHEGVPFVVHDTQTDPRTSAAGYGGYGIYSFVSVSARRHGEWRFLLTVNCAQKREWQPDEIQLVEELTARIFPRLERARAEEALRRQTTLLNTVNDNTTELIFMKDVQGRLTYANQATLNVMGLTAEEALGSGNEVRFANPDEAPAIDANDRRVLETGETLVVEEPYTCADGERRIFLSTKSPLRDEAGAIVGVIGVSRDITERNRAEEAVRESEEKFRLLADNISQLAWMTDADGWIFWYNQRWFDYTGTTLDEMQGWGWQAVHAPEEVERVTAKFKHHIAAGEVWEDTFPLRSKEGEYRWFLSRAIPIRDAAGKILRWFGTNTDITDQKRAEAALRESDRWFRQLADSMPQIVWTSRPDGYVDYFNQRWYAFIGEDRGHGYEDWLFALHPDDRQPCFDHWQHCLQTGEPYRFEFRLASPRRPGDYCWYLSVAEPFHDEAGRILKWFGSCINIHDQKTEAERLEALVRERTQELRASNAELERSNFDLMQFASVASHDLKEPLRKIQAFGNILTKRLDGKLDDRDRDYFNRIIGASDRMQALVEDVLGLSKLSSTDVRHVPVDLNAVVARIADDLEITIREKGATLRVGDLPTLAAVPGQMHQLFQNLLANALKFTQDRPPVVEVGAVPLTPTLRASLALPAGEFAVVEVRDNGIGFEPEYRERIFGMFQRLNGRSEYAGTGIGLTICRKIVENHQGFITADGRPGEGATFRVVLPVEKVEN